MFLYHEIFDKGTVYHSALITLIP